MTTQGIGAPKAILDANVLYVAELRDLLLTLADHGLFHPRWTSRIQQEWTTNLLQNRPDIPPERLGRTTMLMELAFPAALIAPESYERLERDLKGLPNPDDLHVLAAAVAGQRHVIVTYNLRDFPDQALVKHGLAARHPDDFLHELYQTTPAEFLEAVDRLLGRLRNPVTTRQAYIDRLTHHGLPRIAAALARGQWGDRS